MKYKPKQETLDFRLLVDPIYFTKTTAMKLSQAITQFRDWRGFKVTGKTVVRYDKVLRIFCLCQGNPEVQSIKLDQIIKYMQSMEELGWQRNGISIVALALRKFFEFCNLQGMGCLNEQLIPLPRKVFNIPRVANEEDFKKLLEVVGDEWRPNNMRNKALLMMVWDTWARAGEVISLDEDDLVFHPDGTGEATIRTEKSRGRRPIRQIFWTTETTKALKKWLRLKRKLIDKYHFKNDEAVFISISKTPVVDNRGSRMTTRGVCEIFRLLSNRARLGYVLNAHSARHFGGRHIIEAGGSSADVSNILGHSNLESSYVYQMLWGSELRERYRHFKK